MSIENCCGIVIVTVLVLCQVSRYEYFFRKTIVLRINCVKNSYLCAFNLFHFITHSTSCTFISIVHEDCRRAYFTPFMLPIMHDN